MKRISKTQKDALLSLCEGKSVAASRIRADIASALIDEGFVSVRASGSKRSFTSINPESLKTFLTTQYEELKYIDASVEAVDSMLDMRAEQAAIGGNSKLMYVRSCPGFPVNSYSPLECELDGKQYVVHPPEGTFIYVADWESFRIPAETVVVGIENMENFIHVRRQKKVFEECLKYLGKHAETDLLFVSRYPQSSDLKKWLQTIPNAYVHFGDFDLAGINIFSTEFQKYIGDRASYLIPRDLESRIKNGSSERYNAQYAKFKDIKSSDPRLQELIDLIHSYRRGYDQEGYIALNALMS